MQFSRFWLVHTQQSDERHIAEFTHIFSFYHTRLATKSFLSLFLLVASQQFFGGIFFGGVGGG
jgi:hypothetical protein